MIHPEALKRLNDIRPQGFREVFERLDDEACIVLDYGHPDDPVVPGSFIPVITLALRPQLQEAPNDRSSEA